MVDLMGSALSVLPELGLMMVMGDNIAFVSGITISASPVLGLMMGTADDFAFVGGDVTISSRPELRSMMGTADDFSMGVQLLPLCRMRDGKLATEARSGVVMKGVCVCKGIWRPPKYVRGVVGSTRGSPGQYLSTYRLSATVI